MSYRLLAFTSVGLTVLAAIFMARGQAPDADVTVNILPFPFPFPPFFGIFDPWWFFGTPSKPYKTVPQQVAFACFGGGGNCECPSDLNKDSGVLINVFPGFQCAYPDGACTWEDVVRILRESRACACDTNISLLDRRAAEQSSDQLPVYRDVQPHRRVQLPFRPQRQHRFPHQPVHRLPVRIPARRMHLGLRTQFILDTQR